MSFRPRRVPLLLVAAAVLAAGCFTAPSAEPADPASGAGATTFDAAGASWTWSGGAGARSTLAMAAGGPETTVGVPEGALVVGEDGALVVPMEPVVVPAGGALTLIPSPGLANVTLLVGGESVTLPTPRADPFVSGAHAVRLLEIQRDEFPHRTPGHENYVKSQAWFAQYFQSFGYDVEVDPFGTNALAGVKAPTGSQPGPQSVANVVAFKRGTMTPERFIVFGGHYDVVERTRDGAFDNTAGTVAVLELARAFANVTTQHTLVFALWGGEEDGILGSQFWVSTNPEKMPFITTYVNMDVSAMAWPGPAPAPDPIVVTGGPDGPVAERLLAEARHITETFMRFEGAEFLYQPMVVGGQVGGAGVNAQSDHTPFASRGVPSYFVFAGNIDTVFSLIHKESDTLANMTAYMATGMAPYEEALSPDEEALGRDLLARSFETQLWLPVYLTVLHEQVPARVAR